MSPFRTVRKKMGDMLLERKIITQEQLNQALEAHKKNGGYLSQHLISLGFATEIDIATCLSNQYNFAYMPLNNYSIAAEVLEIIPLKWVKIYTLIPLDKVGNVLSVAMADPLNEGVIQVLQQITNCDIQVFISTYSELSEAINKYFGEKLQDLKEVYLDVKDLGKIATANEFVLTKVYNGPERREYTRINMELGVSYYFHGKTFQSKTINVSYGGLLFTSEVFIPLDTSLACKVYLKEDKTHIDVVISVLRVAAKSGNGHDGALPQIYEIAGMFDFIAGDDRETLVSFLKEKAV